jgi:hypothetical protein
MRKNGNFNLSLVCQKHANTVTVRLATVLLSLLELQDAMQPNLLQVPWYHFPPGLSNTINAPQTTLRTRIAMIRRVIGVRVSQNIFQRDVATMQRYVIVLHTYLPEQLLYSARTVCS